MQVGDLTYFGADLQPNYAPDRWNYPYDHCACPGLDPQTPLCM